MRTVLLVVVALLIAVPLLASGRVVIGTMENPPDKLREAQQIINDANNLGADPTNPQILAAVDELIAGDHSVVYFTRASVSSECTDLAALTTLGSALCAAKGQTVVQASVNLNQNFGMIWCSAGLFMRVDTCE